MPTDETTEVIKGTHQCNNCGAYADSPERIKHYKNCKQGESKKWEKFYEEDQTE